LIFLSPPWERIEVRGNIPFPFFTLTLALSPQREREIMEWAFRGGYRFFRLIPEA
jgi:hypothetical protein